MADPVLSGFFVVGGTLRLESTSYVSRPADEELLRLTLAGEYCNVLTARQMGKSSLMVRTAQQLNERGMRTVIIDLTTIGSQEVSASEWYFGLVAALASQLDLTTNVQEWWQARKESGLVQRFNEFLRNIVLEEVHGPIVVFIDEVDSTLKRRFTDDFFATIRAAYNARANIPAYRRLTFVLLGVARPADLIKDRSKTPYNIGVNVDVTDFQLEELGVFQTVFESTYLNQGKEILDWILNWTGGQPYLTQKIGDDLVKHHNGQVQQSDIDSAVERLFLAEAKNETNLRSIRDRVKDNPYAAKMLRIYQNILHGKQMPNEEHSVEQNELKLTGLIRVTPQGMLAVRNRLYARVFDESWVKANTPVNRTTVVAISASVLVVILAAILIINFINQQNQTADIKAQTYIQGYQGSNSPEVRLTNLAGLFGLGGQYAQRARDLFYSLPTEEQVALFKLSTPQNVANELVVVVESIYQKADNTTNGNALLASMSDILRQVGAAGAPGLTTEIEFWVQGRELADKGQYETAISLYDTALSESEQRKHANSGIHFDRAIAYVALKQYDAALADFEASIALDKDRQSAISNEIQNEPNLMAHWSVQANKYTGLSAILPTVTPTPTSTPEPGTFTPTPTWTLTPTPTQTPTPTSTPTSRPPTPGSPTPSPTQQVPSVNGIQFGSMTYGPHRQTITDGMNMETGGLSIYYTVKNTSDHNVLVLGNQGVAMRSPKVETFLGGGVKWPGLTGHLNPGQIAEIEVRLPFDLNCQNCEIYPSISAAWQELQSRQIYPESWQPSSLHNQVSIMPPTQDLVFSGAITGVSAQRIKDSSARISIAYEGLDPNATYSFVVWSPDFCPDDTRCLDYTSSQQSLSGYALRGRVTFIPEVDGKGVITAVVEGISCKGGTVTTNSITIASVRVSPPATYIRPQSFPLVYTWCE
jgi:hypothetical protein